LQGLGFQFLFFNSDQIVNLIFLFKLLKLLLLLSDSGLRSLHFFVSFNLLHKFVLVNPLVKTFFLFLFLLELPLHFLFMGPNLVSLFLHLADVGL